MTEPREVDGVAIIGMAGRFPGAASVDELWSNLCAGVESVGPFDEEDLLAAGAHTGDPNFVNSGAQMEDVDRFDAEFFGMGRREAELTDPQHRVVLEMAWAALEQAGYDPGTTERRIGIFGGVGRNQYFRHNLLTHPQMLERAGDHPVMLASEREYAILRAAFKLGLRGPAVNVNTACSTSGVATHLAIQSLLAGDSDMALAGGARVVVPRKAGYVYQEGSILSADGHVRAFDADARGTVIASGAAFIVLKRVDEAIEDGDTIYAVIRGSAINNDGSAKIGLTAPGIDGQAAVIEEALSVAEVDPATIGMVEAHGTGTLLGDPIEIAALTRAYRRQTDGRQYCSIGSLKSNIGHLDTASGVAGIIKAALSLHHGLIPPSVNLRTPNPRIDFESSPFFMHTEVREWPETGQPRRAGVSSFGFGGTNAHLVLEEAPRPATVREEPPRQPQVLLVSAKTEEALEARRQGLAEHLAANPEVDLAAVAYTLAAGRSRMSSRAAVVADDIDAAVGLLRRPEPSATVAMTSNASSTEVAFLFTGQGAQYPGMGAALYRTEPVFAAAIDECAAIVGRIEGHDLADLLYGDQVGTAAAETQLMQTAVGQPAILALQYGLARLWDSWGVRPAVVIGHSVGELAAACLGGVLTLEQALRFAVVRGRLMQDLPTGAMTAVVADETAVMPLLDEHTAVAAVNAPEQCVASGPPPSIEQLEHRLKAAGIRFRRLPTDRAFHSPMMDPVLEALREHLDGLTRGGMSLPMVSTVTGQWVSAEEVADPGYWARHARQPVRFADAVGSLLTERPDIVLLEVGPGATLSSLVRQHPDLPVEVTIGTTLPHPGADADERIFVRRSVAEIWAAGVDVDWVAVNGARRGRVPLPTYPFARERYWIERADTPAPRPLDAAERRSADPATAADVTQAATAEPGPGAGSRKQRIAAQLTAILADMSGLDPAAIDPAASFGDLGFDSLFLTQLNAQFRREFKVRITLAQMFSETPSVAALAEHLDGALDPEAGPTTVESTGARAGSLEPIALVGAEQVRGPAASNGDSSRTPADLAEQLIKEQLRVMDQQLDVMRDQIMGSVRPRGNGSVPNAEKSDQS